MIIAVILILYFEKCCCFARYRCLKHLFRRITRRKKSQSSPTTTQSVPSTPAVNPDDKNKTSPEIQEYLWIAGQREHITSFEPTTSIFMNEFSM